MKALLPTISSILCILTFVLTFFKQKKVEFNKWDIGALALGLIASIVWFSMKSATYANLILQVAVFIGFIPTLRSTYVEPKTERPFPWFLWAGAFILGTIVVFLRWKDQWQDLVYPLNALVWHIAVGWLALRKK